MKWSQLAIDQPALGAAATERLIQPGVLLIGTTRQDGTTRISGVEPLVLDGELWLSMMQGSTKERDLRRDPRILLHSVITGPEPAAELKLRGTARVETDPDVSERYAVAVATKIGWQPVVGQFTLLAIDIEDVTYLSYDPDTQSQHVARWPADTEYIRPSITPTSLGAPQPVRRLLR